MSAPPRPPEAEVPVTPAPRPPLVKHPGRVAVVVGTLAVVITLVIVALAAAETDPGPARDVPRLPSAIESLRPGPGELARLQDTITVDLRDDLTGVILVDGAEIPEDQLERVVPLGQVSFRTGPDQDLTRFEAGTRRVTVYYWPQKDLRPAQPASYTWEFRAGA